VSGLITVESGRYYNIFAGSDANVDGNPNSDRLSVEGRNSHLGPGYAAVDVRVAR
jgi:hypothetical protein